MRQVREILILFVVLNLHFYLVCGLVWHSIKDIQRNLFQQPHYCTLREIFYDYFLGGNPYVRLIKKIFFKDTLLKKSLIWERNKQRLPFPAYKTLYEGRELYIRVNNFPEEHLYTLLENGTEIVSFDDWPEQWDRHHLRTFTEPQK